MPFKPGQSGNPSGRPKECAEVKALARQHTGKAIQVLASIMLNEDAKGSERVAAATALLDRGYGKPAQTIDAEISANVKLTDLIASLPIVTP